MPENQEPKKSVQDPIAPEVLHKLAQISNSRLQLADRLLDFEQEKVQIIVATRQLDEEKRRIFSQELTDRGLAPNAPVEVDSKTGIITIVSQDGQ